MANKVIDYRLIVSDFVPVRGFKDYAIDKDPGKLQINTSGEEWLEYLPRVALLGAYNLGVSVGVGLGFLVRKAFLGFPTSRDGL